MTIHSILRAPIIRMLRIAMTRSSPGYFGWTDRYGERASYFPQLQKRASTVTLSEKFEENPHEN